MYFIFVLYYMNTLGTTNLKCKVQYRFINMKVTNKNCKDILKCFKGRATNRYTVQGLTFN